MDLVAQLLPKSISPIDTTIWQNIIPYLILLANFVLFRLLRSLSDALLDNGLTCFWWNSKLVANKARAQQEPAPKRLLRLLIGELISTCELCADCAELNVVYEKHGAYAYAAGLFLLSYLWIDAFGEAQTTPGYLAEELLLIGGPQLLASGETYARFIGQSMAMPLAWRFASLYWHYHLLAEHTTMLEVENCKSALSTSTIKGFLIEFGCCLLCRLIELIGHRLLERKSCGKRLVSLVVSFTCTLLVMVALELSGGYFNPILAASLEYGCKGIHFYQHATVFWFGPLLGHVFARVLFRRFLVVAELPHGSGAISPRPEDAAETDRTNRSRSTGNDGRPRRTTSQRRKRHRD